MKLLLEREHINLNTADTKYGRTPLWWAAKDGHEGIVRLLLDREDVNPEIPALDGTTALRLAASGGHVGVVQLLYDLKPSPPISSPSKPLPPHTHPPLITLIFFVIIFSIFLFYILLICSSLSDISLLSFHR